MALSISASSPVTDSTSKALTVKELHCSYGGVQAVKGVSLEIAEGSFVGLIGPNGAGKSTLLDCLSGRNRAYRGSVHAWDVDISHQPLFAISSLGIIRTFQVARPFGRSTVLSNLMMGPPRQKGERFLGALFGTWHDEQRTLVREAVDLLKRFGLEAAADQYGSQLSGGQERLLELSRAMMARPRVLLLDEPFAGVSPANRIRLADQLRDLFSDGKLTVVMVEHRLEWVERLCARIVVMAEGRVIADGSMREIRSHPQVLEAYLGTR